MEIAQKVPPSVKIGPWCVCVRAHVCVCASVCVPTRMHAYALLWAQCGARTSYLPGHADSHVTLSLGGCGCLES